MGWIRTLVFALLLQTTVTVRQNYQATSSVVLTWVASAQATSYFLKRAEIHNGPYTTIQSGIVGLTATDRAVQHGHTYYYVVVATDGNMNSVDSNEATAVIP